MITFNIFVGLFVMSLCLILQKLFLSSRVDHHAMLPNGTMGWPFIGKTLSFIASHETNSLGRFLQEQCSRHGKVFKSHLFGSPTIVSCDHEFNVFVLQNEEKLFKASYLKAMMDILGKYSVLSASDRDLHKKLRNVMVSFIAATKSSSTFHRFSERLTRSVLKSWEGQTQVFFQEQAKSFTLNIIAKAVLSIEPDEPGAARILQDFRTFMRGFVSLPLYIPWTPFAMAIQARARLSSRVKEIIEGRKKINGCDGGEMGADEKSEGGDFLDMILWRRDLSDEEKVSLVVDILLGGFETTASALSLVVYFLGRNPLALDYLKEEHKAIRQSKDNIDEPLNHRDYKQMEFTNKVIWEALRCGNIVKFLQRKAIQDIEFKGYVIPSGWKVFPVIAASHTDPILHENPLEFNPWRWNKGDDTKKKLLAFGGGLRQCPGGDLAKTEIATFIHHLVLNYKWKLKDDEVPLAYPYVEFKRHMLLEIEPIGDQTNI